MPQTLSKRVQIRIISFSLAGALLLFGAGFTGYRITARYRDTVEYKYQQSINDLSDYVSNIKTTLQKGLYSNTAAGLQPVFAKLMTMSEGAKNALAVLPVSGDQSIAIQKYLAQVGDYSFYSLKKLAKNEQLSNDELDNLKKLYSYACTLDTSVGDLAAAYGDGAIKIGKPITLKGNITEIGEQSGELTLDGGFREMNEGFTDYPTMIYDGPFSDHIEKQKPALIENKTEISQTQALVKAAAFAHCSQSDLYFTGKSEGSLPTYNFTSLDKYITVTQKGGYIDLYIDHTPVSKSTLSVNSAIDEAAQFLRSTLGENFKESYYSVSDNICTINFAYTANNIIYYSDLVKVGVSLQTGEIVSYCATGYIMNHKARPEKAPSLSADEAKQYVNKNLNITSSQLAVIPTAGKYEVLTYEFRCKSDNNDILVYINTDTGNEEQLYIVLKGDNGVLVI